jgi:hypothetical protein
MPGLDFFTKRNEPRAARRPAVNVDIEADAESQKGISSPHSTLYPQDPDVYYNPRLDPQNYLEGPLSCNPATRLRQMLARPGIVVCITSQYSPIIC